MANQLGKRYVCAHCATQLLVVKPGPGRWSVTENR
jgi:hypothetical protein